MIKDRKKILYYRWLWSSVLIAIICGVLAFTSGEPVYYYPGVAALYMSASYLGMRGLNRLLNGKS